MSVQKRTFVFVETLEEESRTTAKLSNDERKRLAENRVREMSTFSFGFKTPSAAYLLYVCKINSSLSGCCFANGGDEAGGGGPSKRLSNQATHLLRSCADKANQG
ncbi:hypothetical protein QQ045_007329 [Rhodiola kirilowii]